MLHPPKPMDFTGKMADNWKKFKQRFELYKVASGAHVKNDETQVPLLLHVMGDEALEVYNSFTWADDEEKNKYEVVLKKFEDMFMPKKNVIMERFEFNQAVQGVDEEFDQFITRIKNLASTCEFETLRDSLIRDRIVVGVKDKHTRERLLRDKDLSLEKAMSVCKTAELSKQHIQKLITNEGNGSEIGDVQKMTYKQRGAQGYKPGPQPQRVRSDYYRQTESQNNSNEVKGYRRNNYANYANCARCATSHRTGQCPAYGKRCGKCQGMNHYARCCRTKNINTIENQDEEPRNNEDDDSLWFGSIMIEEVEHHRKSKDWICPIHVEGKVIPLKLDTGAQANVLSLKDFKQLKNVTLHPAKETLKGYTGNALTVMGKCLITLRHEEKQVKSLFYVCDGPSHSLLGKDTCEKFELIKLMCKIDSINESGTRQRPTESKEYCLLMEEYEDVFQGLGCLPGEYNIEIDETAVPRVQACRKIPFPLHEKLKLELERMQKMDVIVKVEEPTDWVSSIVVAQKPNGKLRVCLDPRHLNDAIKRQHFKLPTREEVMAKFGNAKIFSKLDASQGFWQMKLTESSSKLTTFITPFGRYRYKRLPFGIKSASEVFHKNMKDLFEGVPNVDTSIDDIIVTGKDKASHDQALKEVFKRARANNLKLNKEKCQLGVNKLVFLGDQLTDEGIKPDPRKVSAIRNMPKPTDKAGIQRFLGMVTYMAKWIPNLSAKSAPLRELLDQQNHWVWEDRQEAAFNMLRECLVQEPTLAYYDPARPSKMASDASKDGLGAVLLQLHNEEWKPVAYASRAMTSAETRYAQIEKELLAIAFACQRFHQFIYGATVGAETDHKPLVNIFKKALADCPIRIQRLMMQLQRYDLKVNYIPGKMLVLADTLSRAVEKDSIPEDIWEQERNIDLHVSTIIETMPLSDERMDELRQKSNDDSEMTALKQIILKGWPQNKENCPPEIIEYWHIRDELSVAGDIVLRGSKLVIPKAMRKKTLDKIHEGHMGIEKCRRRAREALYWPGINREVEQVVNNCSSCLKYSSKTAGEPLQPHEIPLRPWQRVASDMFSHANKDYLIITDYYSFYPEVLTMNKATSAAVIEATKAVFARHGTPDVLITDNGPQYASKEFQLFTQDWSFQHKTSSPHFPSSNGLAEAAVKTIKRIIQKTKDSKGDLYQALQAYRATQLASGKSPAQLLMQRRIKTSLPIHPQLLKTRDGPQVVENKKEQRLKQKLTYDKNKRVLSPLEQGAHVRMYDYERKLWQAPAKVVQEVSPRSYLVQTEEGVKYRRNRADLKPAPADQLVELKESKDNSLQDLEDEEGALNEQLQLPDAETSSSETAQRRSNRVISKPNRLIEEC